MGRLREKEQRRRSAEVEERMQGCLQTVDILRTFRRMEPTQFVTPSILPYLAMASAITASTCAAGPALSECVTCSPEHRGQTSGSSQMSELCCSCTAPTWDAWSASATTGWQPGADATRASSLDWSRPCNG